MLRATAVTALTCALVLCATRAGADAPPIVVSGAPNARYARLDARIASYLQTNAVPDAELAVSVRGEVVFSHAYTNSALSSENIAPKTVFRLASNSKAWTCAAIAQLMADGALTGREPVFAYLGIHDPLPTGAPVADPRVFSITVRELVDHTGGWDRGAAHFDPVHAMRRIAIDSGLDRPVSAVDVARYMLGQPLQHAPGTTYAYSNLGYLLLGLVIEKASGEPYLTYVQTHIAQPLGVSDLALADRRSATAGRSECLRIVRARTEPAAPRGRAAGARLCRRRRRDSRGQRRRRRPRDVGRIDARAHERACNLGAWAAARFRLVGARRRGRRFEYVCEATRRRHRLRHSRQPPR